MVYDLADPFVVVRTKRNPKCRHSRSSIFGRMAGEKLVSGDATPKVLTIRVRLFRSTKRAQEVPEEKGLVRELVSFNRYHSVESRHVFFAVERSEALTQPSRTGKQVYYGISA